MGWVVAKPKATMYVWAALPEPYSAVVSTTCLSNYSKQVRGDVAKSWVGTGPNRAISPDDLASALGADQVNALSAHSGLSQNDLLEGLSQYLPQVVDHLTPNGRMPTDQELSRSL